MLPPRAALRLLVLSLGAICTAIGGCFNFKAGSPVPRSAPEVDTAIAWPQRRVETIIPFLEKTPEVVEGFTLIAPATPDSITDAERAILDENTTRIVYKGVHGRVLLRILSSPRDDDRPDSFSNIFDGFTPNTYGLTSRTVDSIAASAARRRSLTPDNLPTATLPARPEPSTARLAPTPTASDIMLTSGKPMRIPPPLAGGFKPVGVILHLTAMYGNEFERDFLKHFRDAGWAVVDIRTESQVEPPVPSAWLKEIHRLRFEDAAIAKSCVERAAAELGPEATTADILTRASRDPEFIAGEEHRRRLRTLSNGAFQLCSEADASSTAREIAAAIDDALAGNAYSCEAVLHYIDHQRPDLQGVPVVLMGFSAGAIAAPAAAALIAPRLSAVVLVGGGANIFMLSQESTFSDGGVRVLCDEKSVPKPVLEASYPDYLNAAQLDGWRVAPLLSGIPVLQVHASQDTWVPAKGGELLWERLGKPDRLVVDSDHDLLFYFLPEQAPQVDAWLNEHVPALKNAPRPARP